MRKVSSRNLQTTVSNGLATRHNSRITDAPVLRTGLREVTTWRLDGSVYPSAAKLSG